MENNSGWLFPTTSMEALLKFRPKALALLEKVGINPWTRLNCGIGLACAEKGVTWETFETAASRLPLPSAQAGSVWQSLPICDLVDYLTAEHREFIHQFIPSIGRILSQDFSRDPGAMLRLGQLCSEWPDFVSTLTRHLREEEDVLFHRILRYDYCLRKGDADPDFEGGSVRVFASTRMLKREHRDLLLMKGFLEKAIPMSGEPAFSNALENALGPLLSRFQSKLAEHARLEAEILIPRAGQIEKMLYDRHIAGRPHAVLSRRD